MLTWDLIASIQRQQDAPDAQLAELEPSEPQGLRTTAQGSDFEDFVAIVELTCMGVRWWRASTRNGWTPSPPVGGDRPWRGMGAYRRARKSYVAPTPVYDERNSCCCSASAS